MENRVSVCIPVFNAEAYIKKTIEGVLKQSFQDFELLVIDNASTDRTAELVKEICDPRLRLIQNKENVGMTENWNLCLRYASCEYIQILCADDMIYPLCLEKKYEFLEQNPELALVFSASHVCNSEGKVLMMRKPFHANRVFPGIKFAKKSFCNKNYYGEPSNVMFRWSAAKKAGEFHALAGNLDWEYWLRLSTYGMVGYIAEPLSVFRVSDNSDTSKIFKQKKQILLFDQEFVDACRKNQSLGITRGDFLKHWFMVRFFLVLKSVFIFLSNRPQRSKK